MVRECATALVACLVSGCSLILDFSGADTPPPDARYSQAECDYKEPNDTRETASMLGLSDTGPAAVCPKMAGVDDRDFYKVSVPANTLAKFQITYGFSATGDLDLQLTDAQGSILASSRGFANTETITCPGASPPCAALAPGDYWLEVFPAQPGMANRYELALTITP
ncbi:MAG TPA: PPC domain-containing protein [Kofleriaceae bacterium]|nr:PPC domain-containing protein [Kofleriaceae bacterium]